MSLDPQSLFGPNVDDQLRRNTISGSGQTPKVDYAELRQGLSMALHERLNYSLHQKPTPIIDCQYASFTHSLIKLRFRILPGSTRVYVKYVPGKAFLKEQRRTMEITALRSPLMGNQLHIARSQRNLDSLIGLVKTLSRSARWPVPINASWRVPARQVPEVPSQGSGVGSHDDRGSEGSDDGRRRAAVRGMPDALGGLSPGTVASLGASAQFGCSSSAATPARGDAPTMLGQIADILPHTWQRMRDINRETVNPVGRQEIHCAGSFPTPSLLRNAAPHFGSFTSRDPPGILVLTPLTMIRRKLETYIIPTYTPGLGSSSPLITYFSRRTTPPYAQTHTGEARKRRQILVFLRRLACSGEKDPVTVVCSSVSGTEASSDVEAWNRRQILVFLRGLACLGEKDPVTVVRFGFGN
ncbi:hypothetical protein BU17DRAFT_69627 [Hysterangium stoloniferum]|nr:hypothetical protein BU17DRAFT_69627 [Hysterangium stoloniferum]